MPFPKGQGMGAASDVRVVPLTGSPHAQQQNASDSRAMWPRRNCDLPGGSPEPHSHSRGRRIRSAVPGSNVATEIDSVFSSSPRSADSTRGAALEFLLTLIHERRRKTGTPQLIT